ncbi:unannotated protein [freshwater metagenome]|uniref:Unannotated protein n=1 Tax=freshwater metagenome TaxID=449393 RepID=A0A6J6DH26_9ZZZZ
MCLTPGGGTCPRKQDANVGGFFFTGDSLVHQQSPIEVSGIVCGIVSGTVSPH